MYIYSLDFRGHLSKDSTTIKYLVPPYLPQWREARPDHALGRHPALPSRPSRRADHRCTKTESRMGNLHSTTLVLIVI